MGRTQPGGSVCGTVAAESHHLPDPSESRCDRGRRHEVSGRQMRLQADGQGQSQVGGLGAKLLGEYADQRPEGGSALGDHSAGGVDPALQPFGVSCWREVMPLVGDGDRPQTQRDRKGRRSGQGNHARQCQQVSSNGSRACSVGGLWHVPGWIDAWSIRWI
jgi:hypothetical protein